MMRTLILLPVLLVAACSSKPATITVDDGKGGQKSIAVAQDGGTTTISSGDGKVEIKSNPGDVAFPAFAPQYPGSKVVGSASFSGSDKNGSGVGNMITQETTDEPAAVMAFYKGKIAEAGMKTSMETTTPAGGLLMVGSGEGQKGSGMMITISKSGEKTMISYMGGHGQG
jgi:hypothetical protein